MAFLVSYCDHCLPVSNEPVASLAMVGGGDRPGWQPTKIIFLCSWI